MGKDLGVKGIYGSGMVLQRDKINCIYGVGDVFSDVIMSFRGVTSITQVDENGEWKFEFSPGEAGGPFEMSIKSDAQKIDFTDIYVGEVWVNAGEGNARLTMDEMKFSYPEEFKLPENKNVRMFSVPANYSFNEKIDFVENEKWKCVSPETIGAMSGLGYFFGKKLSVDMGVPVGIINMAYDDAPITSWMSRKSLEEMGDKSKDIEIIDFYKNSDNLAAAKDSINKAVEWHREITKSLKEIDFEKECSCESPDNNSCAENGWTPCTVPGVIKGPEPYGIIWMKKEIMLTEEQIDNFANGDNSKNASLWLGLISCIEEVFFNGVMVGASDNVKSSRRFEVPVKLLKKGRNILLIKLFKNVNEIRFYEEKPYRLFSNNVFVAPCVYRNIGVKDQSLAPIDGEDISLEGQWMMKIVSTFDTICEPENLLAKPTAIYNGVLPACFKYAVAGVLWTQGESDFDRSCEYKGLLTKLITLWRRRFTYWSRDLPFIVVQLPNWANGGAEGQLDINSRMSTIRKAQLDVAGIVDKVGLVVNIDGGEWNDLYGEKKLTLGTRCEFEALRVAYNKTFISPAPKLSSYEILDDKFIVKFNCGNSSLHTFEVNGNAALLSKESGSGKVYGFSFFCVINGEDTIIKAPAKLVDPFTVEVSIPEACRSGIIYELRYLWGDCPAPVNLYSRDMIPAGPFSVQAK